MSHLPEPIYDALANYNRPEVRVTLCTIRLGDVVVVTQASYCSSEAFNREAGRKAAFTRAVNFEDDMGDGWHKDMRQRFTRGDRRRFWDAYWMRSPRTVGRASPAALRERLGAP